MKTIEADQAQSDLEEVCRLLAEGKSVTDPELSRRVRERSERITEQIRLAQGLVDDEAFQSLLDDES